MFNDMRIQIIRKKKDELLDLFRRNWLFYASKTPIWNLRITENRGRIDTLSKSIIFENEDYEEGFYDIYGYDPDEQSLEVIERIFDYRIPE